MPFVDQKMASMSGRVTGKTAECRAMEKLAMDRRKSHKMTPRKARQGPVNDRQLVERQVMGKRPFQCSSRPNVATLRTTTFDAKASERQSTKLHTQKAKQKTPALGNFHTFEFSSPLRLGKSAAIKLESIKNVGNYMGQVKAAGSAGLAESVMAEMNIRAATLSRDVQGQIFADLSSSTGAFNAEQDRFGKSHNSHFGQMKSISTVAHERGSPGKHKIEDENEGRAAKRRRPNLPPSVCAGRWR